MIFSKGKRKLNTKLNFDGFLLQQVESYKYLGFEIFYNGNLKHSANALYDKSLKALFSLKSKLNNFENIPIHIQIKLFDTLIIPIATYGAEVWISDFNIKSSKIDNLPFEKLHNKFCKIILGVHKKSSNLACRWELGRSNILDIITRQSFKYYKRLSQLPTTSLLFKAFQTDRLLAESSDQSMTKHLNHAADQLNLNIQDFEINDMISKIQTYNLKSRDDDIKSLRSTQDSKLNFFSNICEDFGLQTYLKLGLPKSQVRYITKLRISAHRLQIEVGRYSRPKIQRQDRVCKSCDVLEDELHFLLRCRNNQHEREKLFKDLKYTYNVTDNDCIVAKFLLNPKTKQNCSFISSFIENTMTQ